MRVKPSLWELGGALLLDGVDAGRRMDAMTAKVEAAGGVPAAGDGAGCGIWCIPCGKLQPLAKPFDLFPWNKHVISGTVGNRVLETGLLSQPASFQCVS